MIAEFYAPTRGRDQVVLQHRDGHGERWLSIQLGTPVVYEDLAGTAPHCEPERVQGIVAKVELRLVAPEPRLLVWLEPCASAEEVERLGRDDRGRIEREPSSDCWGEFAINTEMAHAACRSCTYLHDLRDGPHPPRPHARPKWKAP